MTVILTNLRNAVIAGFGVALVLLLIYIFPMNGAADMPFWRFLMRWAHVLAGVMWIGHLWYFNFTQIPTMPKIPDELKPAVGKFIAPKALFWFRWGAVVTIVTGLLLAWMNGYILEALSLGLMETATAGHVLLGIGMWLGLVMFYNVWAIIWPNQQRALNIDNKYPDLSADDKAKAARSAMLFSRTNTILSIPMLFAMVAAQNLIRVS
jgi:uncharacterized membrane protein